MRFPSRSLLLLLVCLPVFAQQPAWRVVDAKGDWHGTAGIGDHITLKVQGLPALLDQEAKGDPHRFVLFLDETPIRGIKPQSVNRYDGTVRYLLDRIPGKNDSEWHELLGGPQSFVKPVHVSIGVDDQFYIPTSVLEFPLLAIPDVPFYLFLIILAGSIIFFVILCRRTTIIRSPCALPTRRRPYSLSRFQLAWWFFLVIVGYVFMWLITGELDTITSSVLALIGIGSGTALGAALIDQSSTTSVNPGSPVVQPDPQPSRGFLNDMITDSTGAASIHRFQMFVWTLILGVIFIVSVYHDLAMPEFNSTLLGLMGISSGTYLGFKFPEKKEAAAQDQSVAATPER